MARYTIIAGLDVGGTKIRGILYDLAEHSIEAVVEEPTATDALASFLAQLERIAAKLQKDGGKRPEAIGVGVPSFLDRERKRVLGSTNFDLLADIALSATLSDRLSLPVRMENDANCAALAEAALGAGHGKEVVAALTVGTGIGGGIVVNGEIFTGAHGGAGEVGYLAVADVVLSGMERGTARQSIHTFERHGRQSVITMIFGESDPAAVEQDAREGDKAAKEQYDLLGRYLGVGISSIVNLVDPSVVAIAGGIAHAWDLMEKNVMQTMRSLVGSPAARDGVEIVPAALGSDAGAVGAALLWAERLGRQA